MKVLSFTLAITKNLRCSKKKRVNYTWILEHESSIGVSLVPQASKSSQMNTLSGSSSSVIDFNFLSFRWYAGLELFTD